MLCLSLQPERQEKGAKPSFHLGSIYLESVRAACTVKQTVIFVMDFAQRSTLHFKLGYNVEGTRLRGLDGQCRLAVLWAVSFSDRLHVGDGLG